jgi:NADPH-dependent glutamate synthase beta subunit-like oxidoreductase
MNAVISNETVRESAEKIADKCMGLESPFCKSRCPMHTDVKEYVARIAEKDYGGAVKIIRETLFLPGTLGRICAHPCEEACRRGREFGEAISIAALKRFAADRADEESLWDVTVGADTGKHVAVIGAGPAGAQAAIDLRKAGHAVTIYEREEKAGGMLRAGIPKYRLPRDVVDFEYGYLDKLGISLKTKVNVGEDVMFDELLQKYDAVLLAVGAQKGNVVKIPGHTANGVYSAIDFLREVNQTETLSRDVGKVVVIGGGDVAMDCARSALRIGAKSVYQASLESLAELPASREELEQVLEEGVDCHFGWGPMEIVEEDGNVKSICLREVTSVFDEDGRFHPQYGEETRTVEADTIIMATGQAVEDVTGGKIAQGGGGRYQVDAKTLATAMENVFVAGDAGGGKIVVEAMALGRKAAISIDRYLSGKSLEEERNFEQEWSCESKLDVPLPEGTKDLPRLHKNMRPVAERTRDFAAVDEGFTEGQAVEEASRCLKCECGLCMKECIMLEENGKCPREIFEPLLAGKALDMMLSYSCNDCGNCTIACPHELPVREAFMESRKDFVRANGGELPLKGHRPVKIHQTLGFSSMFTTKVRMSGKHDSDESCMSRKGVSKERCMPGKSDSEEVCTSGRSASAIACDGGENDGNK